MRLDYHLVNVFLRDGAALSGNPLCVVESPDELPAALMQSLARQFNLSETTFVSFSAPPHSSAAVRIFTPDHEMPFAGHPTLGTAHVVRRLRGGDQQRLSMPAGIIPVEARGDRWTLTAGAQSHRPFDLDRSRLAAALGLEAADLGAAPLWVDSGAEQLIVPLASPEAVRRAQPQPSAFLAIANRAGRSQALVFAPQEGTPGGASVLARFFFDSGGGVAEDPATGSACANLGAWFIAQGAPVPLEHTVFQGDAAARPSTLFLSIDAARGVRVGGDVRYLGAGHIEF